MDFIQRLVLILLLILAYRPAHADDIPATFLGWWAVSASTLHQTATQACVAYGAANGYGSYTWTAQETTYPYACLRNGSNWTNLNYRASCPAGSTVMDGFKKSQYCRFTTPCTAPTIRQPDGTCKSPCPTDQTVTEAQYYSGSCVNGCEKVWNGQYFDMLGVRYYGYLGNTGTSCTTSSNSMQGAWDANKAATEAADAAAKAAKEAADKAAADAKTAADKADAAAKATAAENAKAAAADAKAAAEKAAADKAKTDADPNATQDQKDAAAALKAAADALAASTQQAAAAAVGAAAASQKNEAPEKAKDFCEVNPKSMICKNSAINTGSCAKGQPIGFQCDGDAIFCGIAKSQVTSYCASQEVDDTMKSAFDTMKTENGTNSPAHSSKITTINLPTALDASSPYAAECNPDVTVTVATSTVTLPFSAWCPYLIALGYLFLSMAYLSAAVIISKG